MYNILYVSFEIEVIFLQNKSKLYLCAAITLLPCLSGCTSEAIYIKQGYTQKVVYDLGEGFCRTNNRETHTLTLYYKPGSYITDFSQSRDYTFIRPGDENVTYELAGWYFDEEYSQPVIFEEYTLPNDSTIVTTLYAKWDEIFNKHYEVYVWNENESSDFTFLTSLQWDLNKPFNFSSSNIEHPDAENYTYIEAYKNEEMTELVDEEYVLTKNGENLPIYTKWIKGNYKIINTAADFSNYFNRFVFAFDFYLNADIDLTGVTLANVALLDGRTILGNHHTLSNLNYTTLKGEGNSRATVTLGGFADKIQNSTIKDLNIVNAIYTMDVVMCRYLCFGALAGEIVSSTIENVSIEGQLVYSQNTLSRLEEAKLLAVRIKADQIYYTIDEQSSLTNNTIQLTGLKEEYL